MNPFRLATWLLGLSILAETGCQRQAPAPAPGMVQVRYAQTQCADPWGFTKENDQLATAATNYLAAKQLALRNPTVSPTGVVAVCNACTCTTGLVLTGSVTEVDLPAVQKLGFTRL